MDISFTVTFMGILKLIVGFLSIIGIGGLGFWFAFLFIGSSLGGSNSDSNWKDYLLLLVLLGILIFAITWAF